MLLLLLLIEKCLTEAKMLRLKVLLYLVLVAAKVMKSSLVEVRLKKN